MNKFLKFLFAFVFLLQIKAYAYIPPAKMILQRMVENSGSGFYNIEQTLEFEGQGDPIVVKETWTIDNENQLKLNAVGEGQFEKLIQINNLYSNGLKWTNDGKEKRSQKIGPDFFQKYFHFKNEESLANYLRFEKILDQSYFYKKPFPKKSQDIKYEEPKNVKLARMGGGISYFFGVPTPENQTTQNPGLWVEQDLFLLRKIRLLSGVEINADNYGAFSRGLHYPKTMQVKWDDKVVNIHTTQVTSLKKDVKVFLTSNLDKSIPINPSDSSLSAVQDFYSRFR